MPDVTAVVPELLIDPLTTIVPPLSVPAPPASPAPDPDRVPPCVVMAPVASAPVAVRDTAPPAAFVAPVVLMELVVITFPVAVSDSSEFVFPAAPLTVMFPVPAVR